jgi:excisionase family DNA binding protein
VVSQCLDSAALPADEDEVDSDFDDTGGWIGTPVACSMLAITARELYRLVDEGRIPAYRFGRVIRLRRRDVEEYAGKTT